MSPLMIMKLLKYKWDNMPTWKKRAYIIGLIAAVLLIIVLILGIMSKIEKTMFYIASSVQVLFGDDEIAEEPQSECKWEIRIETEQKTVSTGSTGSSTGSAGSASTSATGNSNEEKIWNFLKSKGLNDYACSIVMGTMWGESRYMSNNVNDEWAKDHGITDEEYTNGVENGTIPFYYSDTEHYSNVAYGLCQWLTWTRKKGLQDLCKSRGVPISDFNTQLDYFWQEINTDTYRTAVDALKSATADNWQSVMYSYERIFEGAGLDWFKNNADVWQARIDEAKRVYGLFAGKTTTFGATVEAENKQPDINKTAGTSRPKIATIGADSSALPEGVTDGLEVEGTRITKESPPHTYDAAKDLWAFFIEKGASEAGAAGLIGGIWVESTFKSDALAAGNFYGYCQWDSSRQKKLNQLASEMGSPRSDPKVQMAFIWKEMSEDYPAAFEVFTKGTDVDTCTMEIRRLYEAPSAQDEPVRIAAARDIYISFSGKNITGSGGSSGESGGPRPLKETVGQPSGLWPSLMTDVDKHASEENNEWTKLKADVGKAPTETDKRQMSVDKFKNYTEGGVVRYSQNQEGGKTAVGSFATLLYNSYGKEFPGDGCGICAASIVFSTLTAKYVNPAEVALAAMTYPDRNSGKTLGDIFDVDASKLIKDDGINALFAETGFKTELAPFTQEKVNECLTANGMVIVVLRGTGFSSGDAGHYTVIREQDTTDKNKYYLVQSAGFDNNDTAYDFSQLDSLQKASGHPNVIYVWPKDKMTADGTGEGGAGGTGTATVHKYILYHTGNANCPKHNGYYCSCGLRSALDIRKEYVIAEDEISNVVKETTSKGKEIPVSKQISGIEDVLQNDSGFPKGSEIASLTALLHYLNFPITIQQINDTYLDKGPIGSTDPNKAYVGQPSSEDAFGCYAGPIVEAANQYLPTVSETLKAEDVTGTSLEDLINKYVSQNNPVIVWVTRDLQPVEPGPTWDVNGTSIQWQSNEHCVLLIGYDKDKRTVTVMDPLKGHAEYNMSDFEARYNDMGKYAVVIPRAMGNSKFTEYVFPIQFSTHYVTTDMVDPARPGHGAMDFDSGRGGAADQAPIVAAYDGEVMATGNVNGGYGLQVVLKHNFDGEILYTKYNHMSKVTVSKGDVVSAGDQIGVIGDTGSRGAIHLDFQMSTVWDPSSPAEYLNHLVHPASIMMGKVSSLSEVTIIDRASGKDPNLIPMTVVQHGIEENFAMMVKPTNSMTWEAYVDRYKDIM